MTTTDTLRNTKPGVVGATIICRSGGYFDFLAPTPDMIHIEDIAWGLANTCRFGGQSLAFYSVAQHSVFVSAIVPPHLALVGLMHDAAEAYVGDVVGPLKQLIPAYKEIETRVERVIAAKFGLPFPWPPEIKHADLRLLRTEQRDLTSGAGDNWNGLDDWTPLEAPIEPLPPPDGRRTIPLSLQPGARMTRPAVTRSAITARLAANAAAIDAAKARLWANYPDTAPAEDGFMTLGQMREMYAEVDRHHAEQRRRALIALWAAPVVDQDSTARRRDGVICYRDNRDDDWSLWSALQATVGLILVRYWSDAADARWSRRLKGCKAARWGIYGRAMAYWDSEPVYGGYAVDVLRLYPGCRIEHFNDGEINL
jgi:uncharacterized protein